MWDLEIWDERRFLSRLAAGISGSHTSSRAHMSISELSSCSEISWMRNPGGACPHVRCSSSASGALPRDSIDALDTDLRHHMPLHGLACCSIARHCAAQSCRAAALPWMGVTPNLGNIPSSRTDPTQLASQANTSLGGINSSHPYSSPQPNTCQVITPSSAPLMPLFGVKTDP